MNSKQSPTRFLMAASFFAAVVLGITGCNGDTVSESQAKQNVSIPVENPNLSIPIENTADMKAKIREKVASANKNYKTLKGKYAFRLDKELSEIEFQIREGDKPASYRVSYDLRTKSFSYYIFDGTYILSTWDFLRDPSVRYPIYSWEVQELRKNPAFPFNAQDMPHPHKLADELLSKEDTWEIERKEKFLGRNAYVILAGRDPHAVFPAEKTRLWVDEQTGILLRKDYLYENDKHYTLVEMLELEINGPLDEQKLVIPPDLIAQLHLPPEQEEKEKDQVRLAVNDFYDQRSKHNYPDPVAEYTITAIERQESAVMRVSVIEKLANGTSRNNNVDIYKKNGQWREYSP